MLQINRRYLVLNFCLGTAFCCLCNSVQAQIALRSPAPVPFIFTDVDMSASEAFVFSARLGNQPALYKAIIAPFKLNGSKSKDFSYFRRSYLNETRINFAQQQNRTTLGFAIGGKAQRRTKPDGPKATNHNFDLNWSLSANITLFPNWGGFARDRDGDGLVDNFYPIQKTTVSAGVQKLLWSGYQFSASFYHQEERYNATEGTGTLSQLGYAIGFSKALEIKYPKEWNERRNKPQVFVGFNIAHLLPYKNLNAHPDGLTSLLGIGPLVQVQLANYLQVRINLPFLVTESKSDRREFGSFLQLVAYF